MLLNKLVHNCKFRLRISRLFKQFITTKSSSCKKFLDIFFRIPLTLPKKFFEFLFDFLREEAPFLKEKLMNCLLDFNEMRTNTWQLFSLTAAVPPGVSSEPTHPSNPVGNNLSSKTDNSKWIINNLPTSFGMLPEQQIYLIIFISLQLNHIWPLLAAIFTKKNKNKKKSFKNLIWNFSFDSPKVNET